MSDLSSRSLASDRVAVYTRTVGTSAELPHALRQAVEDCGGIVVALCLDDAGIAGRGKYAAWHHLIANLDSVDQIAVANAGDLPGRSVGDLLKILAILRDHGVGLYVLDDQIDTASSSFALLDLIEAYRRAKLSQAIRNGQAKAVAAGKRIGRPSVPRAIAGRIQAALSEGGGNPINGPHVRRFSGVSNQHSPDDDGHAMHLLIIAALIFLFRGFLWRAGATVLWLLIGAAAVGAIGALFN